MKNSYSDHKKDLLGEEGDWMASHTDGEEGKAFRRKKDPKRKASVCEERKEVEKFLLFPELAGNSPTWIQKKPSINTDQREGKKKTRGYSLAGGGLPYFYDHNEIREGVRK